MAALGSLVPILIVTVEDFDRHPSSFFLGAAVAFVAPLGAILSPPMNRWLRWPFAFSGLPGLTQLQAHTGGVSSPYAILLVMGMVWFGLMASDLELRLGLVITVACCFLPMWLWGGSAYPFEPAWALALALVNVSVLLGLAATMRETVLLTGRLRHDATHDRLTQLLNRRGWEEVVDKIASAGRSEQPTAVIALLDLDQLKQVNDSFGHERGDALLRSTAEGLIEHFAASVTLTRLGGDEFACLVLDSDAAQVVEALERMRAALGSAGAFSAGVAVVGKHEEFGEAMRRADLALYEAKTTGRNRTRLATRGVPTTLATSTEFDEADERDTTTRAQ
jgi:diguanylate cyclase (GGDEF)-like protein